MNSVKTIICICTSLFLFVGSIAQESRNLFESENILKLRIEFHKDELINDIEVRDYHNASLYLKSEDENDHKVKIKLKVRGNNRANTRTCKFPPLEVKFGKKTSKNTIFEDQKTLKLVTHCRNSKDFSDYITKEYLTYKLYGIVNPISFKVRLCEIIYVDMDNPNESTTHVGFFIERTKAMAKRNGMVVYKDSIMNQEVCKREDLDKLTVFQFMIGNLDWSIPNRHNIKIVSPVQPGFTIAVPYDFDYAGIVSTPYAKPPDNIDIPSVKTRVFRGLCRVDTGYSTALDYFKTLKPDLYEIINNSDYLSDKSVKSVGKYLDSFYDIIDNPKLVNQKIITACRAKHRHLYENN